MKWCPVMYAHSQLLGPGIGMTLIFGFRGDHIRIIACLAHECLWLKQSIGRSQRCGFNVNVSTAL